MTARGIVLGLLMALSPLFAGCFSHFTDGPEFAAIPAERVPAGYGLVYVYRKPRAWGAGHIYTLGWQSRRFAVVSGSYGVFAVPEGTQTFTSMHRGGGFTVDVKHDQPVFVEIQFGSLSQLQKSDVVSREQGLSDIESLHLGAGGGARLPVPPIERTIPREEPPAAQAGGSSQVSAR
jgi:hypothetical protein